MVVIHLVNRHLKMSWFSSPTVQIFSLQLEKHQNNELSKLLVIDDWWLVDDLFSYRKHIYTFLTWQYQIMTRCATLLRMVLISVCHCSCRTNTISCGQVMESEKQDCSSAERLQRWSRLGVCGLDNSGNSCYLNAVLQCLCSTVPFVEHLLNQDTRKQLAR